MAQKPEDIFCIQILNKYLLYAPRLGFMVLLNGAAVRAVSAGLQGNQATSGRVSRAGRNAAGEGAGEAGDPQRTLDQPDVPGVDPYRAAVT